MAVPLTRRSALALLAVGPLTGCTFTPIAWEDPTASPTSAASADDATVVAADYFNRSPDPAPKTLSEGVSTLQRISTPHFDARLDRRFAGKRLSAQTTAQIYEPGAVRAPQGGELIAFTLQAGSPCFLEDVKAAAQVDIVVGGGVVLPLTAPFGVFNRDTGTFEREWVLSVCAVPEGADVALRVTDEGRRVSVDLRTGAPIEDEGWVATAGFREPLAVRIGDARQRLTRELVTVPTDTTPVQTSTFELDLALEAIDALLAWTPEDGWAQPGMRWLRIATGARASFEPADNPSAVMDIDVVKSFLYREGTAAPVGAHRPRSVTTQEVMDGKAVLDVTWLVPTPRERVTITCDPVGVIEALYRDHDPIAMKATGPANHLAFALEFAPVEPPW